MIRRNASGNVLLDLYFFQIYAYVNAITRILSLHERTTINE